MGRRTKGSDISHGGVPEKDLAAAADIGMDAAELAEYARNDIIRREVELRLNEELKKRGLA